MASHCHACGRPFKRTLKQNAYFHAEPFLKLAKAWGMSVNHAKLTCMGEFWGWRTVTVGPVTVHLPIKVHTSDMTKEEATVFLDWLIPWAAEAHGVEIRLPAEWERTAA